MYKQRIRNLENQHRDLDHQVDSLERTGVFDDMQIEKLKKERLHVLDELTRLRRLQYEQDHEVIDWDDDR